eukprot:gene23157-biopygen22281
MNAFLSGPDNIELQQTPWRGRPWHDRPWCGRPWRGRPWRGRPWRGRPWRGRPWRGRPWRGRSKCLYLILCTCRPFVAAKKCRVFEIPDSDLPASATPRTPPEGGPCAPLLSTPRFACPVSGWLNSVHLLLLQACAAKWHRVPRFRLVRVRVPFLSCSNFYCAAKNGAGVEDRQKCENTAKGAGGIARNGAQGAGNSWNGFQHPGKNAAVSGWVPLPLPCRAVRRPCGVPRRGEDRTGSFAMHLLFSPTGWVGEMGFLSRLRRDDGVDHDPPKRPSITAIEAITPCREKGWRRRPLGYPRATLLLGWVGEATFARQPAGRARACWPSIYLLVERLPAGRACLPWWSVCLPVQRLPGVML